MLGTNARLMASSAHTPASLLRRFLLRGQLSADSNAIMEQSGPLRPFLRQAHQQAKPRLGLEAWRNAAPAVSASGQGPLAAAAIASMRLASSKQLGMSPQQRLFTLHQCLFGTATPSALRWQLHNAHSTVPYWLRRCQQNAVRAQHSLSFAWAFQLSQQQGPQLNMLRQALLTALAPYWQPHMLSKHLEILVAAYRHAYARLPAMPGLRHAHINVFGALNAMGMHLPATLMLTAFEIWQAKVAKADAGFAFLPEPVDIAHMVLPWWKQIPLELINHTINLFRTLYVLFLFAPVLLTAPIALSYGIKRAEWMELLRKTLEAAGPAFIKWGQWAATRHDLFPPDMCDELEHLHTQAPGHKFHHTRRAIERSFGVHVNELFDMVDTQPVASGSIGQIHRAILNARGAALTGFPQGTIVAVKVRHPGVGAAIARDFGTMMWVAGVLDGWNLLGDIKLGETLKQFAAPLREQVDLAREASHLQRFNHNFRKAKAVHFPVPLYPLVCSEVLVETFEQGDHITAYISDEGNPINHKLSELGSGTMLQMMLIDNLIHSDLHPGNILVRLEPPPKLTLLGIAYRCLGALNGLLPLSPVPRARLEALRKAWLQPSLVLLDVGMATELSARDQENMVGLFRSFAAMDGRACGLWTLRFSGAEQSCPDPAAFTSAMEHCFEEIRRTDTEPAGWKATSFRNSADALASVLEMVRVHKVSLPGHICAVVVTTMVLEGWSNKLDPTHSVLVMVQNMFETDNVAWTQRIPLLVDKMMADEAMQCQLHDFNLM